MKKLLILSLFLVASSSWASCPQLYPDGKPFVVPGAIELCNSFYVSLYDTKRHAVIVVSERLKRQDLQTGHPPRVNDFHSDVRVGSIPSPKQYDRTGFDRGHMAPAADASSAAEMDETFLMTNMTPQEPTLNREAWKRLEEYVRKIYVQARDDIYVVTVAVYKSDKMMNGIPVPTGYWKIVYADGKQYYFYADNKPEAGVAKMIPVNLDTLWRQR